MNGVEFLFALLTVSGITTLHFLWIGLAYKIEKSTKSIDQKAK
tara:strand:+ start:282 stop:410 length:129 start_codon:yes stop_codon:yes gene_type:complete